MARESAGLGSLSSSQRAVRLCASASRCSTPSSPQTMPKRRTRHSVTKWCGASRYIDSRITCAPLGWRRGGVSAPSVNSLARLGVLMSRTLSRR